MTDTQMSDERIERAAKAMWEVSHPYPPGWAAWGDRDGFGPSIPERRLTLAQARAALEADAPALEAARAEGLRDGLIWAADKARTLKTLRVWLPTGDKPGEGETEHVTIHGIEIAEAIEARLSEMDRQPVNEGG